MSSAALIVTYNRLEKLRLCWQSTAALAFDCIVIVDNASNDGTQQWLATLDDPRLRVVRTEHNLGGAGGFKRGCKFISTCVEVDWVFLFDDDAYPASDLLDKFIKLDKGDYKLLCSKVVTPAGISCKMNLPYQKIPRTLFENIQYGVDPERFLPEVDRRSEVATFSFVGAIIHRDVLALNYQEIHEDLFIYFDDVYFSYHLTQLGQRILYCPELVFVHDVILNANIYKTWKLYYLVRNLILSRKFFGDKGPFTSAAVSLRTVKIVLSWMVRGRSLESAGYLIRGIKDGVFDNAEKRH
ncbi:glycosyltransferase [Serratia fonticola]|uniref:glycosyltransferase n=1 Tax=Serratia fonticola TaxID=47917 RepID=UPI0004021994|nr:glycosyltransferase [Serratia fonticola]